MLLSILGLKVHKLRMSAAPRWTMCAASASMEWGEPNISNDAAREETAAHWVLESDGDVDGCAPNGFVIDDEMIRHARDALVYLKGLVNRGKIEKEQVVSVVTPGGCTITDTCDIRMQTSGYLLIADYNYGWRLIDSWTQALGYAVASLRGRSIPNYIELMILQPRPWHPEGSYRSKIMTAREFTLERDKFLKSADDTYLQNPEMVTGKHCKMCKAAHKCPALRSAGLSAIDTYSGLSILEDLPAVDLSREYDQTVKISDIISKRKDVLARQIKDRMSKGEYIPDYSLVEKLSNRAWSDAEQAKTLSALIGIDITTQSLLTPAQAIKKGVPKAVVSELTVRKLSSRQLVRVDVSKKAREVFKK